MTFIESLLLALALCVDSFVVSAANAFKSKFDWRVGLIMAALFGLCQGGFLLLGALLGDAFSAIIEAYDHWVAFALLAFVGGKMIWDGLHKKTTSEPNTQRIQGIGTMLILGVATSIDSLAVGIGIGLDMPIIQVVPIALLVGVVTLIVSAIGALLGSRQLSIPERMTNILAGAVLILLGVKILLEHLGII